MNKSYHPESQKFFNSKTGKNHRAWADAAAAYYRLIGGTNKKSAFEAMAAYYAKVNSGAIPAPVMLNSSQAVVTSPGASPVQNSAGAAVGIGTYTVASNAVSNIRLPATVGAVSNSGTVTCTVTTTTARTAGQTDSKVITFTVANGVITSISI